MTLLPRTSTGIEICPACGWNIATSDGRCMDCPGPPSLMERWAQEDMEELEREWTEEDNDA